MSRRLIVLDGGTFGGKSTLIDYFSKNGYETVDEIAINIISDFIKEKGMAKYKKWRKEKPNEFYEVIMRKQVELEESLPDEGTFIVDRSSLGLMGFYRELKIEVPKFVLDHIKKMKFDYIFICETLSIFEGREDTGRTIDEAMSKRICEHVKDIYVEYNYDINVLGEVPVEKRIKIMEEIIGKDK